MASFFVFFFLMLDATQPVSPPTAADVMKHAPAQADLFAYAHVKSIAQPSKVWLDNLGKEPFVAKNPELKAAYDEMSRELQGMLSMAQAQLGMNPLTDIDYVAVWLTAPVGDGDPEIVAVAKSKLTEAQFTSLIGKAGMTAKTVNGLTLHVNDDAALTYHGGVVMVGSAKTMEARAKAGFKAATSAEITDRGKSIDKKPVAVVSLRPSAALRGIVKKEGAPATIQEFFQEAKAFDVIVYHNGIDLNVDLTSAQMFARAKLFAEGFADLSRASQHLIRGAARTVLAVLSERDTSLPSAVRGLIAQRDDVIKFVLKNTGDGNITLNDRSNAGAKQLRVELRANHVREVLQPSFLLGAGAFVFMVQGGAQMAPASTPPVMKAPASKSSK